MPAIKPTCVRDLKLRVNLADVVSRVVTLRKAGGARLKGLCPFHNEKSPSFNVDTDKGFYYCFGCNKSGDSINFVRETEQLSFTEAVEALGQRFNIPIEYEEGVRIAPFVRKSTQSTNRPPITFTKPSRPPTLPVNSYASSGPSSANSLSNSPMNSRSAPPTPRAVAWAPS